MNRHKPQDQPHNSAPDFPALRDFFSAYLHQDFRDEYGSAPGAARAFCGDAQPEEFAAVCSEWVAWRKGLGNSSPEDIAAAVRRLGGTWQPQSSSDLDALERALSRTNQEL